MNTYVIGDVQGCFQELLSLLEKINFQPKKDKLCLVGDLVNRGPKSLEVLRFIKNLPNSSVVLGNHDLHLLATASGARPLRDKDTFSDVLRAEDKDELLDWLRHQPLMQVLPEHDVVLVHAGIYPLWSLDKAQSLAKEVEKVLRGEGSKQFFEQMYGSEPNVWAGNLVGEQRLRFIVNAFTRMRYCDKKYALDFKSAGPVGSQSEDLVPWFNLCKQLPASTRVIFGHWAALNGVTHQPNFIALDTGCVWGNDLTAYCLETEEIFAVHKEVN